MELSNLETVQVPNATVEFKKGLMGSVPTYVFSCVNGGHPMVNAMAGLAMLKDGEQLVMYNHCAPMGLYPKIEADFSYTHQEMPNGATQIVFSKKSNAQGATDFSSTSCSGGCG
jgi:uncharacterized protein (DUF2249 family)